MPIDWPTEHSDEFNNIPKNNARRDGHFPVMSFYTVSTSKTMMLDDVLYCSSNAHLQMNATISAKRLVRAGRGDQAGDIYDRSYGVVFCLIPGSHFIIRQTPIISRSIFKASDRHR
jgi:hypothetical protein